MPNENTEVVGFNISATELFTKKQPKYPPQWADLLLRTSPFKFASALEKPSAIKQVLRKHFPESNKLFNEGKRSVIFAITLRLLCSSPSLRGELITYPVNTSIKNAVKTDYDKFEWFIHYAASHPWGALFSMLPRTSAKKGPLQIIVTPINLFISAVCVLLETAFKIPAAMLTQLGRNLLKERIIQVDKTDSLWLKAVKYTGQAILGLLFSIPTILSYPLFFAGSAFGYVQGLVDGISTLFCLIGASNDNIGSIVFCAGKAIVKNALLLIPTVIALVTMLSPVGAGIVGGLTAAGNVFSHMVGSLALAKTVVYSAAAAAYALPAHIFSGLMEKMCQRFFYKIEKNRASLPIPVEEEDQTLLTEDASNQIDHTHSQAYVTNPLVFSDSIHLSNQENVDTRALFGPSHATTANNNSGSSDNSRSVSPVPATQLLISSEDEEEPLLNANKLNSSGKPVDKQASQAQNIKPIAQTDSLQVAPHAITFKPANKITQLMDTEDCLNIFSENPTTNATTSSSIR
jgi:hypothetical protein